MTRTFEHIPLVTIPYLHAGAIATTTTVDVNLLRTSLSQAIQDRIPARLRNSLKGTIVGMRGYLNQANMVPIGIRFFGNDTFDTFATMKLLGEEDMAEADFEGHGGAALKMADIGGIAIPYNDDDGSGEFHLSITNEDAADAIGAGTFKMEFDWRPFFPA
jgi:hypothetical protein